VEALTHRVPEQRSLALHREVARLLRQHPELVARARERVGDWQRTGLVGAPWIAAWSEVLSHPIEEIIAVLTDPGERSCDLRQCSPFAGAIEPRERWRILREIRAHGGEA
jgi:hypothetical protein